MAASRRESLSARRARAQRVLSELKRRYPDARTELEFGSSFQLLIATT